MEISYPRAKDWLWKRRWHMLCVALLAPLFAVVYFAAFWLRFEGQISSLQFQMFAKTAWLFVPIKLAVFGLFRMYRAWGRYITFHDLVTLSKATTVSSLCLVIANYVVLPSTQTPRSVLLLDWGMTILMVGGLLALFRLANEGLSASLCMGGGKRVLIVGTNDSGEALLRAIRRNHAREFRVVGFISEQPSAVGTYIGGVPVLGGWDETCSLALRYAVTEVLITAGELSGRQVRELVDRAHEHDVDVRVLPSYEQLLMGHVDLQPRTVSIEDLLRREPVQLDQQELHRWIDHKVLLVTGSCGSIGSELCRQLLQFRPSKLLLVDRNENGQFFLERELREIAPQVQIEVCMADITDSLRMSRILQIHQPDILFHAAAYKHVPLMEANPSEALKNISLATRTLADLAVQNQVGSFVLISTDKAVNPTSVMGTCKRAAELYVQSLSQQSDCRFVTVRFGNVLDSAGSVVPIFRQQIARGGPVTVTHPDMKRYFMTIPEASQLVIQAGAMGQGGEIFVLDMGQPVRIVDLARDMIRLSGLKVDEDVELHFIGTRPGERLDEILHAENEEPLTTSHPKIMVAQSSPRSVADMRNTFDLLNRVVEAPPAVIVSELRSVVAEYVPDEKLRKAAEPKAA